MTASSVLAAIAAATALIAAGGAAAAEPAAFSAAQAEQIESCADASAIVFGRDRRASLDAVDASDVALALMTRYPVIERDGFALQSIVLWRKAGDEWIYIGLIANPARPKEVCFTATFTAGRFDFTTSLTKKYFGVDV